MIFFFLQGVVSSSRAVYYYYYFFFCLPFPLRCCSGGGLISFFFQLAVARAGQGVASCVRFGTRHPRRCSIPLCVCACVCVCVCVSVSLSLSLVSSWTLSLSCAYIFLKQLLRSCCIVLALGWGGLFSFVVSLYLPPPTDLHLQKPTTYLLLRQKEV